MEIIINITLVWIIICLPKHRWIHNKTKAHAPSGICTVNMNTWIWTLTLIHTLYVLLFLSLHLLSSNFVLIHLIISSIILPPPCHLLVLHDCLFIYPFTPLSLNSPSWTHSWSPYLSYFSFINLPFSLFLCHFLFAHSAWLNCCSPSLSYWVYLFLLLFFHFLTLILCRYLQFTLRLGSRSTLSSCPAPDQPGEGVLLHYSSDNGITWTLLQHYAYQGFHEPRYLLCLVCVHRLVWLWFHRDTVSPLKHTFALLMVCWRCKPLGPIELGCVIYVCNEDKVGWLPAVQARSQSSTSPLERPTRVSESGTSST